jgi:hypothetical protein
MDLELRKKFCALREDYKKLKKYNMAEENFIVTQLKWCNVTTQLMIFSGKKSINGYAAIGISASNGQYVEESTNTNVGDFKIFLGDALMEYPELFPVLFTNTLAFMKDNVCINRLVSKYTPEFLELIFCNPPAVKATQTMILACSKREDLPYIPLEIWNYMFVNFIL